MGLRPISGNLRVFGKTEVSKVLALRGGREKGKRTAVTTAIKKNYEIFPFFILFLMMLLFINPAGLLAVPLPPQNLGIHDGVGGSEVTLEWNSNSEPDLAGYIVYWDIDSGPPYANEQNVGPNTSYTLSGLTQDVY